MKRGYLGIGRLKGLDRLDLSLVVAVVALALASAAAFGPLPVHPPVQLLAPGLDLVLDTAATVVTGSVSVLALARYRERGEPVALFHAAAFMVLALANGFALVLGLGHAEEIPGLELMAPGQAPVYVASLARLLAAALLVTGGIVSLRRMFIHHPRAVLLVPALATLVLVGLCQAWGDRLPALSSVFPDDPRQLRVLAANVPLATPLGGAVQLASALLFLWAVGLMRRVYRRDRSIGDAYVALGLVFAAFAQLHLGMYPGTYPGVVTSGDGLRLAFDVFLLLGIDAEARSMLGQLRRANQTLEHLGEIEADRAALEERARLARELHDGLAQDLFFAKLKTSRLTAIADLHPEARALGEEVSRALDAGLEEARQAVMTLRIGADPEHSFTDLLSRSVDDFQDRYGVRAESECSPELRKLPTRVEAELLRIVQEALSNVVRHADATLVRVEAAAPDGTLTLSIRDNGRGFDPGTVEAGHFGLATMRERAALLGADIAIETRPQDGTRVVVTMALPPQMAFVGLRS
jgi:signal transduction histidine kinase